MPFDPAYKLSILISLLEDTGYLARAALIADRTMARFGLQGKSFIPLLSAYGCAVPAIMATRTIESKRDRLATIFIAPFMSCSARLPVYTLFIGAFIPNTTVYLNGLPVPTNIVLPANNPISAAAGGTAPVAIDDLLAPQFGTGGPLTNQAGATYLRMPEQLVLGELEGIARGETPAARWKVRTKLERSPNPTS